MCDIGVLTINIAVALFALWRHCRFANEHSACDVARQASNWPYWFVSIVPMFGVFVIQSACCFECRLFFVHLVRCLDQLRLHSSLCSIDQLASFVGFSYYNIQPYHAIPASVNVMSNAFAQAYLNDNNTYVVVRYIISSRRMCCCLYSLWFCLSFSICFVLAASTHTTTRFRKR